MGKDGDWEWVEKRGLGIWQKRGRGNMQKREREKVQKREGEKVQKGRGGGEAEGVTLVSARGGDRPCEASGAIKKSSLPP